MKLSTLVSPRSYRKLLARRPDLAPDADTPTATDLARLKRVHGAVHHQFYYQADDPGQDTWGIMEKAKSLFGRVMLLGDCDDFAVECLDRLLNLGTPRNALRLAICRTETGQLHLVLLAHTSDGDHVLDNRQNYVHPKADLPYCWLWAEPYRASA